MRIAKGEIDPEVNVSSRIVSSQGLAPLTMVVISRSSSSSVWGTEVGSVARGIKERRGREGGGGESGVNSSRANAHVASYVSPVFAGTATPVVMS